MTSKRADGLNQLIEQAQGMFKMNSLGTPQVEHFWKAQDDIVSELEAYSKDWFKRRHEAVDSALDTANKLNGNGADTNEVIGSLVRWQQQSMQRMVEDVQQWAQLCSKCAGMLAGAQMDAGKEAVEKAQQASSKGVDK